MGDPILEKYGIYNRCLDFSKAIMRFASNNKVPDSYRPLMVQLVRSGTSIGANMMEASEAQSARDFVAKLSIALKEAKESVYWLILFREASLDGYDPLFTESEELVKILAAIKRKVSLKV